MDNKVLEYRIQKGLKRYELARLVGISGTHLYYIEKGIKKPSVDIAIKIAKVLGTTVEKLFLTPQEENTTFIRR